MTKTKISHEGQLCRKCQTPVIKKTHDKPTKRTQAYWFKWWLACPNPKCRTIYMQESAKVWNLNKETGELL